MTAKKKRIYKVVEKRSGKRERKREEIEKEERGK